MTGYIVVWDFARNTPRRRTFYEILAAEFPELPNARVAQSAYVLRDEMAAKRLIALAQAYGAQVYACEIGALINADTEAREFVNRITYARLHRRGRRGRKNKP